MHLLFVHGWGLGPDSWYPVIENLDCHADVSCLDFGFFGSEPKTVMHNVSVGDRAVKIFSAYNTFPDMQAKKTVVVGHSLGVLWLLKRVPSDIKGLISLCGFNRFVPHINPKTLTTMENRLRRNPARQLQQFWITCGLEDYNKAAPANVEALQRGLHWLKNWEACAEAKALTCNFLCLAARNDHIVSTQMNQDLANDLAYDKTIHWHLTGGHALPLTAPKWVAEHISTFMNDLTTKNT